MWWFVRVCAGGTVACTVVATSWTASVIPMEWNARSNQTVILSLMGTHGRWELETTHHLHFLPPPPPSSPLSPAFMYYMPVAGGLKLAVSNYQCVCFGILHGLMLKTKGKCSASNGLAMPLTE